MVRVGSEPVWRLRRDAHPRWSSKFSLGDLLRLMQRQSALVGLLIAAIFVGSIDVAMRTFFARGTQPHTEKLASAKMHDRLEPDTAKTGQISNRPDARTPQTSNPSEPKAEIGLTEVVEGFSVSNIHPTDGFVTASATHSASSTQPNSAVRAASASQSRTAAEPHSVPLPRRKPKRPIAKEAQSSTAELKRTDDQRQGEGEPKPMAFGSIGYNYNPQH
jgi:hypothetical protein